jgi:hypothetical protein
MKILMLMDMSGSHDGQPYKSRGESDDVSDEVAQELIASGAAKEFTEAPADEAPAAETPADATS